jgi:hypothetical protein
LQLVCHFLFNALVVDCFYGLIFLFTVRWCSILRCPVLFNGTNYHDWVPHMRLYMRRCNFGSSSLVIYHVQQLMRRWSYLPIMMIRCLLVSSGAPTPCWQDGGGATRPTLHRRPAATAQPRSTDTQPRQPQHCYEPSAAGGADGASQDPGTSQDSVARHPTAATAAASDPGATGATGPLGAASAATGHSNGPWRRLQALISRGDGGSAPPRPVF